MALHAIFEALKNACGMLKPKWFMSDCAEQFCNAWKGVFDNSETKER